MTPEQSLGPDLARNEADKKRLVPLIATQQPLTPEQSLGPDLARNDADQKRSALARVVPPVVTSRPVNPMTPEHSHDPGLDRNAADGHKQASIFVPSIEPGEGQDAPHRTEQRLPLRTIDEEPPATGSAKRRAESPQNEEDAKRATHDHVGNLMDYTHTAAASIMPSVEHEHTSDNTPVSKATEADRILAFRDMGRGQRFYLEVGVNGLRHYKVKTASELGFDAAQAYTRSENRVDVKENARQYFRKDVEFYQGVVLVACKPVQTQVLNLSRKPPHPLSERPGGVDHSDGFVRHSRESGY